MMKAILMLPLAAALLLAARPLTVDDLITIAVENSPDLNVSRAAVEAARQNTRMQRAGYLPQLDLSASAGTAGVKTETSGVKTDKSGELLSGGLTASQLLYDFGKTGGSIRAAAYDVNASDAALSQALSDKVFDVKEAYYGVLKALNLIGLNRENVTLNEQQLYRAQRYYTSGIRTKIDVTDARVNLIDAQLKYRDAQYELEQARINLERVIGVTPFGGDYNLSGADINTSDLYRTLPDVNQPIGTMETFAYAHRQELRKLAFNVQSAQETLTSARGDYYPSLSLQGSYTRNVTDEDMQVYFPKQQWGAGVGLGWNLFGGWRTDADVGYAKAQVMRSRAAYDDAKLRIKKEVAQANTQTLKRRDNVKLSQSLAEAAREKFVQASKRYEYGLSDYIELQQARQGYIDAGTNLITQYYNFFIALAQRDRAMGK